MSFITERYYQILENHRLYHTIVSQKALSYFMERHVICVWVYHALLQSLYLEIIESMQTVNSDDKKECVRLVTEIVMDEIVEDLGDGQFQSNLELYVEAMEDIGANVSCILSFFDMLGKGFHMRKALEHARFPKESLRYAKKLLPYFGEPAHKKAAALFYEGEPYIPDIFLGNIESLLPKTPVTLLLDYFESHIEGLKRPGFSASGRLVEILCRPHPNCQLEAEKVAEKVMRARIELWNHMAIKLKHEYVKVPRLTIIPGGKAAFLR